ncbi:hypothetical protein MJO29_016201 [Puccinia striiformis f. sp. tritici]|uniref:BRCT domain-containing protein n=1 Tax=Puccinia striiformis f. sp. tritici PST-78 TaxID=1165861 RepID=A0A0L0VEL8_9BASI|nr:hypothetical protein Pst134EA_030455 [Puccinia striiformis f. sp. tritici]KAH9446543.1 hypothetical protein Pst134EA_030455 [Puccinia striiformis f. sp. tritici]KAI7934938.1 hypothetical protein MJO29_016201 [Puccinia striiformis f. sp. tritici]KAI9600513.1 hypothetical protein H4Q26_000296 [Puccinia striiformis f. sp. tritici PST-130]KNE97429.1 hypothetical protein PSTG_09263 [Puccinia striiformis f. sp. tritici PST-78]
MDSIPPQDPRPGTIKKAVSWEVDSPHRVLVNATPSDSSPSTSPRQREETQEESYMDALLADTQPPLDGLSTVIDRPSSPTTCAPKKRSDRLAVLADDFPTDLHFPDSPCFTLGPETQKARLSMENNARLVNQDLSNDDIAFFPHFQPEDSSLPSRAPGTSSSTHNVLSIVTVDPSSISCDHQDTIVAQEEVPGGVPDPEISMPPHGAKPVVIQNNVEDEPIQNIVEDEPSPSISHNAPDGVIPLQSTYPEEGAHSPHPPDITLDLAFDRANQTTHLEDTRQLNSDHYSTTPSGKTRAIFGPGWNSEPEPADIPPIKSTPVPFKPSPINRPSQIAVSYLSPPLNADPIPDSVSPEAAQIIPTESVSYHSSDTSIAKPLPHSQRSQVRAHAKSGMPHEPLDTFEKNQESTFNTTATSSEPSQPLSHCFLPNKDSPLDTTARIDESLSITEVSASREVTRRAEAAINDGPRHEESDTSRQLDDSLESRQNLSVISNQSSAPPDLQASSQHHTNSDENNITGQMFQSEQSDIDGHLGDEQTTSISLPPLRPTDSEVSQSIMDDSSRTVEPTDGAIEAQVDATDVIPPALADIHSSSVALVPDSDNDMGLPKPMEIDKHDPSTEETRPTPLSSRGESCILVQSEKRKRSRYEFDQESNPALSDIAEDEPNTVQREENSSSLARQQSSGEMTTSSPAVPATSSRTSSQSSTSVRLNKRQTQARQSSAVSVVVPRFRKSKAPLPSRTKAPLPPAVPSDDGNHPVLPVQRVLAYRTDWEAFAPGEVYSVTPDKLIIKFDDHSSLEARDLGQLRLCHIRVGDVVKYIGTDLADGESQMTTVREPKRVLRVEKADEYLGTPINSRNDLLVTCDDCDYARLSQPSGGSERSESHARFLVEAVMVIPPGPRRHTGLKDRMLPQQILNELSELMKAHSGVGMRAKLAVPHAHLSRATKNIDSTERIFEGFGILLTGAAATTTETKPVTRRRAVTSSPRGLIEQQIRDRHGTVIGKVSELYELKGTDLVFDRPVSAPALVVDPNHLSSYSLSPLSKHDKLRTILLVAEAPVKTLKYLLALALGIPCVSTKWVTHSCEHGYALDWEKYMIGPGPSMFLGGAQALVNLQIPLINRSNHDVQAIFDSHGSLEILKDKSFIYISSKSKPKSDWNETVKPILCASGAARIGFAEVKSLPELTESGVLSRIDYILLEDQLPLSKLPAALRTRSNLGSDLPTKRRKLVRTASASSHTSEKAVLPLTTSTTFSIVDFEWLKQSLIYGRFLKPQLFATSS